MIVIRSCSGFDELEACVRLEVETWGYDPSDVLPRKAFLLMQKIGGQVIGAFDTEIVHGPACGGPESLVGFALSLPGMKNSKDGPRAYLHSHMLAVREEYQNRGLGTKLKLEQRQDALKRGIRHMEWTFDPLEIKNAYLNLHKLGAIARRYEMNFYGASTSRLQGGLPTDRLVAEWELDSPRVEAALKGRQTEAREIEARIQVPAAISAWRASEAERERALAVQTEIRKKLQAAFSHGFAVVNFTRDAEGNGIYELGPFIQSDVNLESQGMYEI
jgi:predicted GNAT superfamily acetyltransferase